MVETFLIAYKCFQQPFKNVNFESTIKVFDDDIIRGKLPGGALIK